MWRERMRTVTVEILDKGEMILGSRTNGQFMVRKFEDDIEMGGEFFKTVEEAGKAVTDWSGLHYLNNTIIDLNLRKALNDSVDIYAIIENVTDDADIISRAPSEGARSQKPRTFKVGFSYKF